MSDPLELQKWIVTELSSLLQCQVTEEMANHIIMIESQRDLDKYLCSLLDPQGNPHHQKFVKALITQKQALAQSQGYKKQELSNYIPSNKEKKDKKKGNQKPKNDKKSKGDEQDKKETKKNKFLDISDMNFDILLQGRHTCECQASKHSLINNCLKCGRIICEQEGPGPCLFCGNPVYARGEQSKPTNKSHEDALELKNRLLEYDKTSEIRTTVIDDESDYFSTNSVWLSEEQREALRQKEEELQEIKHSRTRTLLLDFTGRAIIDDDFLKLNQENAILGDVSKILDKMSLSRDSELNKDFESKEFHPQYIEPGIGLDQKITGSLCHNYSRRVQDKELLEMSDDGMCLSLHQPWASLLIAGIKTHEGRCWYSSHRGRLWIAAAAKPPTPDEIEGIKNQYKMLKGNDIKFPSKYPTACLLGYVNIEDCLTMENYLDNYSENEREVDSAFVFICSDPTPCPVLFPIKGQHKIYKLEPKIHQAAAQCIQKLSRKY